MAAKTKTIDEGTFHYLINHVFLPPKLPQQDDTNPLHEKTLLETVSTALQRFRSYFQTGERPELDRCIRMTNALIYLRDVNGFLNLAILDKELVELSNTETLAIHVRKQNAGLPITRIDEELRFESFGLLARNEDVMTCKGRLRRQFPGSCILVQRSLITDSTFREPFVDLIVKLDRENGPRKKDEVKRSKNEYIGEEVHTVNPWRVTEMITGLLRGLGRPVGVERISKNTREEALWEVSLQITFERSSQVNSDVESEPIYKAFMVFLMTYILSESRQQKLPSDLLYVMMAKISRRLMKIQPGEERWMRFTEKTMQEVGATMKQDWESMQSGVRDTLDLSALQALDFARDTNITMNNLRPYLEKISSPGKVINAPKAKVVEGPSFQRNEKNYLPKSNFSQDRDFMLYELADFENWVGSNLGRIWDLDHELPTHVLGVDGSLIHETPGKQLGPFIAEVNLFPFKTPMSFYLKDTEAEDGYIIPALQSSEVKHIEDLHRQDKLLESGSDALPGPVDDKWSYTTDNLFATRFFQQAGVEPTLFKQRPSTHLEGSNLLAGSLSKPILRICASPDPALQATQIGFPILPQAGGPVHFGLLGKWLQVCGNKDHENFGCHAELDGRLPTRVLDVGNKVNPDRLRLYCTTESDRGEYVALSHCWGKYTREERERFCTFRSNFKARCEKIDFKSLAQSFQDAITVTRALGKQYLWIDSLCIIQEDEADWEREAKRMETVFSQAYCTIAATSATGSTVGFLGPRPNKEYISVSDSSESQLYLCETVDDFTGDVVDGVLNKRGWVYQERALSRRMIHFTTNQTYWECGAGIHCETMTRMKNPTAQFLGDPQFPSVTLRSNHAKRIRLFEILFERHSNLGLSFASDRSFAIAGLERRMAKGFDTEIAFGIFKSYIHRSLFWRRSGDKLMRKIEYPKARPVPSWSWMAYDGNITYADIPTKEVEWSSDVELLLINGRDENATASPELKALVIGINIIEIAREKWQLILDVKDDVDIQKLRCVLLGRETSNYHGADRKYYVLLVFPLSWPNVAYERIGVATVQQRHLMIEQGGLEMRII
ncbi:uncharacterized protein PAC_20143 [Phialocephala subalpina]|uniref:Uncharacterized protein n=1 Tax=Phialocephala subalpina TaxID=576137 RepID=A0A1L7XYU3_9HELO|nr:uncharacterized protein PAC_20143 [Phialocephala subalpina]